MSTYRAPSVSVTGPAKSNIATGGAEPQPGILKTFPGGRTVSQKVSSSLDFSIRLRTAQCPVLVVDGIPDSQRVFIREESDVGLRLGQIVEHASVCDTLLMGSDCTGGEIRDQTLAITFNHTAATSTTVNESGDTWKKGKEGKRRGGKEKKITDEE